MREMRRLRYIVPLAIAAITLLYIALPAGAVDPALPSFQRTWDRTDKGVAEGVYSRTWFWGPLDNTLPAKQEAYAQAPGGMRTVQYYDKSRMEDNSWRTTTEPWDVTNGLLANELMTGKMQIGDNSFENRTPAQVNVAGDPVMPNGATYAVFGTKLDLPAQPVGTTLIQRMNVAGEITDDASLAAQGINVGFVDDVTKHGIAAPFWDFMNSSGTIWNGSAYVEGPLMLNPFFATGRPRTEAYWDDVLVDGNTKLVLTQCFERRCLTYTPSNSELWRTEMGNIGAHYYTWRTDTPPPTATATTPVGTPTATSPEPTATSTSPAPTPTSTTVPATNYVYASQLGAQSQAANDMQNPIDIAHDSAGNMYVLDSVMNRIQKFDPNGVWITNWGSAGNSNLEFSSPFGITIDPADNIYVADWANNRVQKFNSNFVYQNSFDSPPGGFSGPTGVAADTLGNVYVVDNGNNILHKYSTAGVYQTSWPGSGGFNSPWHVAVSPNNARVYVTDTVNDQVQVFDSGGTWIMDIGSFGTGDGEFDSPTGITVSPDNTSLYVSDNSNNRIQKFTTLGVFEEVWGGLLAGIYPGEYDSPAGLNMMGNNTLYVSDQGNARVQSINTADGAFNNQLTGDSRGRFQNGYGLAVNADGETIATDIGSNLIKVFNPDGSYKNEWTWVADTSVVPTSYSMLDIPLDVAVDSAGNIYTTDSGNHRVVKFDNQGNTLNFWGALGNGNGAFNVPTGIATDEDDNVYVVDQGNSRVQKFDSDGMYLDKWGTFGNGDGEFNDPTGIHVYGDLVYVVDQDNNRVQVFDRDGNYVDQFGSIGSSNGQFLNATDIATDSLGFIYVTDTGNDRVQKFRPTLAYLAQFGVSGIGDGELMQPLGIDVHANGDVSVMDSGNWRIQTFMPS